MDFFFVLLASLFGGFVDAIVGGGGLVLVPALFATFPNIAPATLLGSNKGASMWGTLFAVYRYRQRVTLKWRVMAPAMLCSFACSLLGAWTVTQISAQVLRQLLPFALVAVLIYTWRKKDLGLYHLPHWHGQLELVIACLIGSVLGFYDGFFGPGAGSFLIFLLVRTLGYDFLHASAGAKLLNLASNVAAFLLFACKGHVWWELAFMMALVNVIGSWIGTHLALKHGTGFIRVIFLCVVIVLILKTTWTIIK